MEGGREGGNERWSELGREGGREKVYKRRMRVREGRYI